MKLAVLVSAAPYTHQACDSALQFVSAALAAGHQVLRVFFYHDGVYCASRLSVPPQDERNLQERWSALAVRHGVDLVACIAAAQRRGMLDEPESRRHGKDAHNLAPGFRLSGLGQLIEAGIDADRVVVFGD